MTIQTQKRSHGLHHLASRIFGAPLMISRRGLDTALAVLAPRLNIEAPPGIEVAIPAERRNRKSYSTTEDGVAVINICGPLVYRDSGDAISGGPTTYGEVEEEFMDAATDPMIKGILLDIDSPGGECSGVFDLVDMMYSARGSKPIVAAVNDSGFSAAYALASAADKIFVTRTGGVGSVGVIAMHIDQSAFDEKIGAKYTAIFAGERKNDFSPHAPMSSEAAASLQSEVDRMYDLFVSTVARNRNLTADRVRGTQAGLLWGAQGVPMFADAVGTPADALADIRASLESKFGGPAARAGSNNPDTTATAAALGITATQLEADLAAADYTANPDQTDDEPDNGTEDENDQNPNPDPEAGEDPAMNSPAASAANPTQEQSNVPQPNAADVQPSIINEAKEIATLCTIAGKKNLTADFINEGLTLAQVREKLLSLRADESDATSIRSHVSPAAGQAIEQMYQQAKAIAAGGGMTKQQAFARAIQQNPQAYTEYLRSNPQLDGGKTAEQFR